MNNNIKILVTINLESSTLVRKSEPETINWVITKKDTQPSKHFKNKDGLQVVKRGTTTHYGLEHKTASQHLNLSVDSYEYMTSNECPGWCKLRDWNRMSKKARLEAHLQRLCDYLMGKSFTYEVLED